MSKYLAIGTLKNFPKVGVVAVIDGDVCYPFSFQPSLDREPLISDIPVDRVVAMIVMPESLESYPVSDINTEVHWCSRKSIESLWKEADKITEGGVSNGSTQKTKRN